MASYVSVKEMAKALYALAAKGISTYSVAAADRSDVDDGLCDFV